MISKDSARKVAQILFPQLWQTSPVEAIAKGIEFLHEAAGGLDSNSQNDHLQEVAPVSEYVKQLADQIYHRKLQVNRVAKSIGVSAYTVRTWLEGKYQPNEANSAKIRSFLETMDATPEILQPEP